MFHLGCVQELGQGAVCPDGSGDCDDAAQRGLLGYDCGGLGVGFFKRAVLKFISQELLLEIPCPGLRRWAR